MAFKFRDMELKNEIKLSAIGFGSWTGRLHKFKRKQQRASLLDMGIIRYVLDKELSFPDGVNSDLVALI